MKRRKWEWPAEGRGQRGRLTEPALSWILIVLTFIPLYYVTNKYNVLLCKAFPKSVTCLIMCLGSAANISSAWSLRSFRPSLSSWSYSSALLLCKIVRPVIQG